MCVRVCVCVCVCVLKGNDQRLVCWDVAAIDQTAPNEDYYRFVFFLLQWKSPPARVPFPPKVSLAIKSIDHHSLVRVITSPSAYENSEFIGANKG